MSLDLLVKIVLLAPLFGFLFSGLATIFIKGSTSKFFAKTFSISSLIISTLSAWIVFFRLNGGETIDVICLLPWISSGGLDVNWAIKLDSLTSIMLIVVTSISSLVHIYSVSYMHEDESISRFMSYLSLFTFFMLSLVTADNFLQLFFGWEGVGVASYLLIGFWFKKLSANNAAMKAFIANRVGDLGLILAIALIYKTFGSVNYEVVFAEVKNHLADSFKLFGSEILVVDAICILLFVGAMGKSAQIGLHVWLADAMEGPTPVSALIHAATMVTAGVFLVARCSPMFEYSEFALNFITIIGAVTAIFAATIAVTQTDIKKIIAYSTCSQLGYMFFACGISAYSAAIFHLATHAFFKALLFLGAGSIIHALHHEQDIRKMGGIWKKIPITYAAMWIGSLALAGFPPFAGFYSKDTILEAAFMSSSKFGAFAFYCGIIAAFLTAFYSWRLIFLVFHGKNKSDHHAFEHAHESPAPMLIPLIMLSIGSVIVGYVGVNFFNMISSEGNFFSNSIFVAAENSNLLEEIHHAPFAVKIAPLVASVLAISMAFIFYGRASKIPSLLSKLLKPLYLLSWNKWYFDEIYQVMIISKTKAFGSFLFKWIDTRVIDGIVNGFYKICILFSSLISRIQTGYVYSYSLWIVVGIVISMTFLIYSFNSFLAL